GREGRKNKKNRWPPAAGEVVATDRQDKCPPRNNHFDQLLEKLCTNHGYPVGHKFKDCDMMKHLLCKATKSDGDSCDKQPVTDQDKEKPAEESFPEVNWCLVIIGGLEDDCS